MLNINNRLLKASIPTTALTMPQNQSISAHNQLLAKRFPDLKNQTKAPSQTRLEHDKRANDDRKLFEPASLADYVFLPETLKQTKTASHVWQQAFDSYIDLLQRGYQQSPTFRRLINDAVNHKLCHSQSRLTLNDAQRGKSLPGELTPPRLLICGEPRYYKTSAGSHPFDADRAMLEKLLPAISDLPLKEENHPTGAIVEYSNIILKEMGNPAPAQISLTLNPHGNRPSPSAAELQFQDMLTASNTQRGIVPLHDLVEKRLAEQANQRILSLAQIVQSNSPIVRQRCHKKVETLKNYSKALAPLVSKVDSSDDRLSCLKKIAHENQLHQQISYVINKYRDPFDIATFRDGDCVSFCDLYKTLAQACGFNDIDTHNIERPFTFTTPDSSTIPGIPEGKTIEFARHSILKFTDQDDTTLFFDPVFGKQVNPEHYGSALEDYLR